MRTWKGAWRWYSEDMLACCYGDAARVREEGLSFDMFRGLALCHGANVLERRAPVLAEATDQQHNDFINNFRAAVKTICQSHTREVLVISYSRATLGQTGAGHFSPIGGYHPESDSILILD